MGYTGYYCAVESNIQIRNNIYPMSEYIHEWCKHTAVMIQRGSSKLVPLCMSQFYKPEHGLLNCFQT